MRVFVSSTYIDLKGHRAAVIAALEQGDQEVGRMEVFSSQPRTPLETSLKELEQSDILVGIYAHRYGSILKGETKSFVERELDRAEKKQIPVLAFLVDPDYSWPPKFVDRGHKAKKLEALKKRVESRYTRVLFTTPDNLAASVLAAVLRYYTEMARAKQASSRVDAEKELNTILTKLEDALQASNPEKPAYLRYPSPIWTDFERHVYRRKEVKELIRDLESEPAIMVIGGPGSGKTVLLQTIGYDLRNVFRYIYYEDLSNHTDPLLKWHHQTSQGDEYRLTDCIKRISELLDSCGDSARALVMFDNCHRYPNYARHLNAIQDLCGSKMRVLLAARPLSSRVDEEIGEIGEAISSHLVLKPPASPPSNILESYVSSGISDILSSLHSSQGRRMTAGMFRQDGPSTAARLGPESPKRIFCLQLTDVRTSEVALKILRWVQKRIGVSLGDERGLEGWLRTWIGPSLPLLVMFWNSVLYGDRSLSPDERYCTLVRKRFERLENRLVEHSRTIPETILRRGFQGVLRTLAWFAYLDVALPETYLLQESDGLLRGVDLTTKSIVLKFMTDEREILRTRSGYEIGFALPHRSIGTVVLRCIMGCQFHPPSPYPDAKMLTRMAIKAFDYLGTADQDHLLGHLSLLSLLEHLVEPSLVCDFLQDARRVARLLTSGPIIPTLADRCHLARLSGLPDAVAELVQSSATGIEIEILAFNAGHPGFGTVLFSNQVLEAIANKLADPSLAESLVLFMSEKTPLWGNPRIRRALADFSKHLAALLAVPETCLAALMTLNSIPIDIYDSRVVDAIDGTVDVVVRRLRESGNVWMTLSSFNQIDRLIRHAKVVDAVLSAGHPIPSAIETETLNRVITHDGYLNDDRFLRALSGYIESAGPEQLQAFVKEPRLLKNPRVRAAIKQVIHLSDRPWSAWLDVADFGELQDTKWGRDLIEFTADRATRAVLKIRPPFLEILEFVRTPLVNQEGEFRSAYDAKMVELADSINEGTAEPELLISFGFFSPKSVTSAVTNALLEQANTVTEWISGLSLLDVLTPLMLLHILPRPLDEVFVEAVKKRFETLAPSSIDLFAISGFRELTERPDVHDMIIRNAQAVASSFYMPWSDRNLVSYVCETFGYLKNEKAVRDALENLGLT